MGLTSYEETVANLKEAYAILCGGSEHDVGLSAYSAFRCQCAVKDALELLKAQVSGIDQTVSGALTLIREQDRHQAHWEDATDPTWQQCTLCGVAVKKSAVKWVKASEDSNLNYCPHCGAIMTKAVKLDD